MVVIEEVKGEHNVDLLREIKEHYGEMFEQMTLIRDWIGRVYEVLAGDNRYVAKVFRTEYTNHAIQSVQVMKYLKKQKFSVPDVIDTMSGDGYFLYENQVVVLYEYIQGGT